MNSVKTTRIISWDVGIIHLAYCILENQYDTKNDIHNTEILDWDVINLMEDSRLSLNCQGYGKAKKGQEPKPCTKKATYCLELNGQHIGFCKTHLGQSQNHWTDEDTMKLFSDSKPGSSCDYVMKTGSICEKRGKITHDDANYCATHGKALVKKTIADRRPRLIRNVVTRKFPTSQLQFNLVKKIDELMERFAGLGIQGVIIENQPAQKNPKMKSIASTLFDCFMIRCQIDHVFNMNVDFVKMINPSNKLKVNEQNTLDTFKANKDENKKYKLTKELGMQYTRQLLKDDPEMLEYLDLFVKKDDLCDAYLQGRYYLEFRHY